MESKRLPPQTIQAVAVALSHLPEHEGETVLLKTPHPLDTGLEDCEDCEGTELDTSSLGTKTPRVSEDAKEKSS